MARRLTGACALTLAGMALAATTAQAATVSTTSGKFTYAGAAGEKNTASITRTDAGFLVRDISVREDGTAAALQAGEGCVLLALGYATCTAGDGGYARIDGGDSHDTLTAINDGASAQRYEMLGGAGSDDLTGSTGLDIIDGGDGRDVLRGGAGGDVLVGAGGDDDLDGGDGDDRVDGGSGSDELDGGAGNDTASWWQETGDVTVTLDNVRNDGLAGEDWALDIERVQGGSGNDVLAAGATPAFLEGGAGDDALTGSAGGDNLLGSDGDDTITAGAGDDLVFGMRGADSVSAGAGADRVYADDGDDIVDGGPGDDQLEGSAGDDRLSGGDGADRLFAGWGTDWLDGGAGADSFRGEGEGADTVSYADRTAPLTVTLASAPALVGDDGAAGEGDDLSGIERVIGGAGADRLTGTAAAEFFDGGAGTDVLDARGGDDVLYAVDRTRDTVSCGEGADAADVDPKDRADGCEVVQKVT